MKEDKKRERKLATLVSVLSSIPNIWSASSVKTELRIPVNLIIQSGNMLTQTG